MEKKMFFRFKLKYILLNIWKVFKRSELKTIKIKKYNELSVKEWYPKVKKTFPFCEYWCDTPEN